MKIPASPLLIASLALTSSTLAAPVKRDNAPSPNPDNGSFESSPNCMVSDNERRDHKDNGVDRRRSVMLGHKQARAVPKGHRRAVSYNDKRQLTGLVGGNPLVTAGGVAGNVADTANGLIGGILPGQLGSTVTGVTQPLTSGLVDGLNTGNPLGVAHGALGGVGGAVGGLTQGVSGLLPGQLGGVVSGVTTPLVDGLTSGKPVSGAVNTVNGLLGTVGSILPGGLGDTVTGLTNPLLQNVASTADGAISQTGPLQQFVGHNGLVEGVIGGGGGTYSYAGSAPATASAQQGGLLGGSGLLGGVLGDNGLLGGALGQNGVVGGLLGGGSNGGLLSGLGGGLLGGGGSSGGLLGGLLGGGSVAQNNFATSSGNNQATTNQNSQSTQNALLVSLIQEQGGVIRDLGNGQFLTKAGSVVSLPSGLASQVQRLLASVQSQVAGLSTVNQLFTAEGVDRLPAVGDALGSDVKALNEPSTALPSASASTSADEPAGTGKAPTSSEALDLASSIRQNGQAMSDADVIATLQGQGYDNADTNFISLGDGAENVDLGPLEKILFGTNEIELFPAPTGSTDPTSIPSSIPTAAPSASPTDDIKVMGVPAPMPSVLVDNVPLGDDNDDYEYEDEETVGVEEYPNFYSGDNDIYASAVSYASAAVPSASSAVVSGLPSAAPSEIPFVGDIPTSSAMMPQESAGLA